MGIKGVLTAVIVVLLLGGGAAVYLLAVRTPGGKDAAASPGPAPADTGTAGEPRLLPTGGWDGRGTFTCRGMDQVHLRNVVARIDGDGITATGNCELTCDDCTIEAARAITATGNALLTFNRGRIIGHDRAAYAGSNAVVTFSGAAVTGGIETQGFGEVKGLQPEAPAVPPVVAAVGSAPDSSDPLTPSMGPAQPARSRGAPADPFAGAWKGVDGALTLTALGAPGAYRAEWTGGAARTGLAMRAGADRLCIAAGPAGVAIAVYELRDGALTGRWVGADGAPGTEQGARAARKLAARHRTAGTRPDGTAYRGELALKDRGDVWDISWYVEQHKREGIGIPAPDLTSIGIVYDKRDTAIACYELRAGHLHGQRAARDRTLIDDELGR